MVNSGFIRFFSLKNSELTLPYFLKCDLQVPDTSSLVRILVKSFARIHETNLKKQGMLALTFSNKNDYNKINEDDTFNILNLNDFSIGKPIDIKIIHADSSNEIISCNHTYNKSQIDWFRAGSALNLIRSKKI